MRRAAISSILLLLVPTILVLSPAALAQDVDPNPDKPDVAFDVTRTGQWDYEDTGVAYFEDVKGGFGQIRFNASWDVTFTNLEQDGTYELAALGASQAAAASAVVDNAHAGRYNVTFSATDIGATSPVAGRFDQVGAWVLSRDGAEIGRIFVARELSLAVSVTPPVLSCADGEQASFRVTVTDLATGSPVPHATVRMRAITLHDLYTNSEGYVDHVGPCPYPTNYGVTALKNAGGAWESSPYEFEGSTSVLVTSALPFSVEVVAGLADGKLHVREPAGGQGLPVDQPLIVRVTGPDGNHPVGKFGENCPYAEPVRCWDDFRAATNATVLGDLLRVTSLDGAVLTPTIGEIDANGELRIDRLYPSRGATSITIAVNWMNATSHLVIPVERGGILFSDVPGIPVDATSTITFTLVGHDGLVDPYGRVSLYRVTGPDTIAFIDSAPSTIDGDGSEGRGLNGRYAFSLKESNLGTYLAVGRSGEGEDVHWSYALFSVDRAHTLLASVVKGSVVYAGLQQDVAVNVTRANGATYPVAQAPAFYFLDFDEYVQLLSAGTVPESARRYPTHQYSVDGALHSYNFSLDLPLGFYHVYVRSADGKHDNAQGVPTVAVLLPPPDGGSGEEHAAILDAVRQAEAALAARLDGLSSDSAAHAAATESRFSELEAEFKLEFQRTRRQAREAHAALGDQLAGAHSSLAAQAEVNRASLSADVGAAKDEVVHRVNESETRTRSRLDAIAATLESVGERIGLGFEKVQTTLANVTAQVASARDAVLARLGLLEEKVDARFDAVDRELVELREDVRHIEGRYAVDVQLSELPGSAVPNARPTYVALVTMNGAPAANATLTVSLDGAAVNATITPLGAGTYRVDLPPAASTLPVPPQAQAAHVVVVEAAVPKGVADTHAEPARGAAMATYVGL